MGSLFNILVDLDKVVVSLIIVGITLVISAIFTFLVSLKMKGTKSFFVTVVILPIIVASIISMVSIFLDETTTAAVRIVTITVALGLVRFRSVNAKAEELLVLFGGIAIGLISGLGYVVFAAILALVVAILYLVLTSVKIFDNKRFNKEKMLKITIPESLEYNDVFDEIFSRYLNNNELVEVKTTAMGSLFRLSYKIELKNLSEEKQFIDELRTKNGNLEISILPFVGEDRSL